MTASDMARALGRKGGEARAKRLPAAEKRRIASLGGHARLASLLAARRIEANFRYAATVDALRPRARVRRVTRFTGTLPGLRRARSADV